MENDDKEQGWGLSRIVAQKTGREDLNNDLEVSHILEQNVFCFLLPLERVYASKCSPETRSKNIIFHINSAPERKAHTVGIQA